MSSVVTTWKYDRAGNIIEPLPTYLCVAPPLKKKLLKPLRYSMNYIIADFGHGDIWAVLSQRKGKIILEGFTTVKPTKGKPDSMKIPKLTRDSKGWAIIPDGWRRVRRGEILKDDDLYATAKRWRRTHFAGKRRQGALTSGYIRKQA